MQPLHVFIDTSIFWRKSFDLTNESLQKLAELGREGKIFIYSTPITAKECLKNLSEMFDEHTAKIGKLNVHLKNASLQPIDVDKLKESRLNNWQNFLITSKITEIPLDNSCLEDVFEDYFRSEPPFGNKDKKREFPDAFVLATLKSWCEDNDESMYVVSGDQPFLSYCQNSDLIPLDSLEKLLDLYNQKEEAMYTLAHSSFEHLKEKITKEVSDKFQDRFFVLSDLWDCDVTDTEVKEVTLLYPSIISIDPEFCHIGCLADVLFSVSISHDDPNYFYRDSDTKDLMSLERVHEEAPGSILLSISVEIAFSESSDTDDSELHGVHLPDEIVARVFSERMHDRYEIRSNE